MPIRFKLPPMPKVDKKYVDKRDIEAFLKRGYSELPNRRFGKTVMKKDLDPWDIFEESVRRVCKYSLEFEDVDGGYGFKLGSYQVDAVGGLSRHFVIIECKSTAQPAAPSLKTLIRDFGERRKSLIAAAKRRYGSKYQTFSIVLALQGYEPSAADLKFAGESKVNIWSEAYWNSIRALYLMIGSRAKFYVLKELGGAPPLVPGRGAAFRFPAIRTILDGCDLFTLFIPADVLLDLAYVLRIESNQARAYQRFLEKRRLVEIASYIESGKTFKNSIVVALNSACRFHALEKSKRPVAKQGESEIGTLALPRQYASAWIIDGQHRLYGFVRANSQYSPQALPVVALKAKSTAEEAETFLNINSKQKPVNPSIIWKLFGQLDPHSQEGKISLLVSTLTQRRGPFLNKVFVPGLSTKLRRSYKINQANFCDTIAAHLVEGRKQGYPLLLSDERPESKRDDAVSSTLIALSTYFDLLQSWAKKAKATKWIDGFFLTNNGVNVMVRALVQMLKYTSGEISKSTFSAFGPVMVKFLKSHSSAIDSMRRQTSSEGTREAEAARIIEFIALELRDFAREYLRERKRSLSEPQQKIKDLEQLFRNLLATELSKATPGWWRQRVPVDVREEAEKRREKRESSPWMGLKQYAVQYYVNFSEYKKIMCRNDNWEGTFKRIFRDKERLSALLTILEDIRNDLFHGRDLNELQAGYLSVFAKEFPQVVKRHKLSPAAVKKLSEAAAPLS